MRVVAVALAALALGGEPAPVAYLHGCARPDGSFGERGRPGDVSLTAWAVLGLRAANARVPPATLEYLRARERTLGELGDAELVLLAEDAVGRGSPALTERVRAALRPDGAIGSAVNTTIWGVLALRAVGADVSRSSVRYLLSRQGRTGGWGWARGVAVDSNDTAAAVQALRASGVRGAPIRRALAYLRRLQGRDGGFALGPGRGSDAQSTAWAIQAFLAAGARPGANAFAYLARMRRSDGSFRYSSRYVSTPAWVTAQVLPALARKPFPLR